MSRISTDALRSITRSDTVSIESGISTRAKQSPADASGGKSSVACASAGPAVVNASIELIRIRFITFSLAASVSPRIFREVNPFVAFLMIWWTCDSAAIAIAGRADYSPAHQTRIEPQEALP
jgi:hypothetical protein